MAAFVMTAGAARRNRNKLADKQTEHFHSELLPESIEPVIMNCKGELYYY